MANKKPNYEHASQLTADDLRTVARRISAHKLSRLSLPEVEAVVDLVSKVVPAGNVPGMILSGLARLPGRRIPAQKLQQDVNALFSGVEQILDKAVYTALFITPASIIMAYQQILRLAGKEPESAFPEGVWQFYAGYALREDTARHANETHGFDTLLSEHDIQLNPVDRLTAWFMASAMTLQQYDSLLENEWYERVALSLVEDLTKERGTARLIQREWEMIRPYRREEDASDLTYPAYRRYKFDQFINEKMGKLSKAVKKEWETKLEEAVKENLPAYQRQMSILSYLEPGPYSETRIPINPADAQIGIIHQNIYYLLPAYQPDVMNIRSQISTLLASSPSTPGQLTSLAKVKRSALPSLLNKLNPSLVNSIDNLRFAPILISADRRSRSLPLSELRQVERGLGSHALTIFDTGQTMVFDQSHIFFDGAWGTALSEIMTNEALSWARYLNMLPPPTPATAKLFTSLDLQLQPADMELVKKAPHISPEAAAETDLVDVRACISLRKQFKQRNDLLQLTVNDLLVLYRAIHATQYQPSMELMNEIKSLGVAHAQVAATLRKLVEEMSRTNPAMLIPIDASLKDPHERIYPLNVEVPLVEFNLLALHSQTMKLLDAYEQSMEDRATMFANFNQSQKLYLASIAGFGAYLSRAKEIAIQGESSSVGAIKLMAHLPNIVQKFLQKIPERVELLNNLLKGREVFSNVGAVVKTSTLTRFITAKDDNEQKYLAWGIMTDAKNVMRIHLRDFRPHVAQLYSIRRKDIANMITQDYLDSYARGFNKYIRDLIRLASAGRETRPAINKKKAGL